MLGREDALKENSIECMVNWLEFRWEPGKAGQQLNQTIGGNYVKEFRQIRAPFSNDELRATNYELEFRRAHKRGIIPR